jgi:hypothetical protein
MAYFNQERKAAMAPKIKALLKRYGMKGSLAVRHHSTVVLNLKQGPIDFGQDEHRGHLQVNVYWIHENYEGVARKFLEEAYAILMNGNHNNSDIQTDYFDVGWYVDINVGRWNKPYICTGRTADGLVNGVAEENYTFA